MFYWHNNLNVDNKKQWYLVGLAKTKFWDKFRGLSLKISQQKVLKYGLRF